MGGICRQCRGNHSIRGGEIWKAPACPSLQHFIVSKWLQRFNSRTNIDGIHKEICEGLWRICEGLWAEATTAVPIDPTSSSQVIRVYLLRADGRNIQFLFSSSILILDYRRLKMMICCKRFRQDQVLMEFTCLGTCTWGALKNPIPSDRRYQHFVIEYNYFCDV